MKERTGHYHLVGIAGVGMSALAEALHDAGFEVSGSDRFLDQQERMPVLDALSAQGISLFPQDGSGNIRPVFLRLRKHLQVSG